MTVPDPDEQEVPSLRSLIFERIEPLSNYWKTRKAILRGSLLRRPHQYSAHGKGILSPWKFNITQSLASSFVAKSILWLTALVLILPEGIKVTEDPKEQFVVETTASIAEWLVVLATPLALALVARMMAWATLRSDDLLPEKRRKAAQRFLYLDGALGFWPQTLLAIAFGIEARLKPLLTYASGSGDFPFSKFPLSVAEAVSVLSMAYVILLITGGIWQYCLANFVIPRRLFLLNGYSNHPVLPWLARGPQGEPYLRYSFILTVTGLLTGTMIPVVSTLVAVFIAAIIAWFKF